MKQRQNARRKSSAAATEESTEDILQPLSSNSEQGEHRRSPPGSAFSLSRESRIFRSRRRKAFHMRAFSLLPANSHRCRRPGIRQGASKEEKQFQPGQKRTLPSPASAETGRNKKKNCTGKPIAGKARRGKVELKGEEKGEEKSEDTGEEVVAKVEKEHSVTQSGRWVKRTAKMEEHWGREVEPSWLLFWVPEGRGGLWAKTLLKKEGSQPLGLWRVI